MSEPASVVTQMDPNVYCQKYLSSFIQFPHNFIVLRQTVTKNAHLEGQAQSAIVYNHTDSALKVTNDEDSAKMYPISSIESIQWASTDSSSYPLTFLSISLKGEKVPLVIYGQKASLDLWYDGLRLLQNTPPETEASREKLKLFADAVKYAQVTKPEVPVIPPSPSNYPK